MEMLEKMLYRYNLLDKRIKRVITALLIAIMIPLVYWLVHATGGIKYVYSHTMYFPILISGILFGWKGGLLVGLVAGILLGPFMPLEVATQEPQPLFNWIFRLLIFMGVGAFSGVAFDRLKRNIRTIHGIYRTHPQTGIPNENALEDMVKTLPQGPKTIASILVGNHQEIIDALGTTVYHRLLFDVYQRFKSGLDSSSIVVQADSDKLWVIMEYHELEADADTILSMLREHSSIDGMPAYLDYAVGLSLVHDAKNAHDPTAYRTSDSLARRAQDNNLPYALKDEDRDRKKRHYDLISKFYEAFNKQELFLVYQVQTDISTGIPFAVEALLRWHHETLGEIEPGRFIPLVEKTKMIHPLTDFVIEEALKTVKRFEQSNIDFDMAVNISAKNLYDPSFSQRAIKLIRLYDVDPSRLVFEVTESALMMSPEESTKVLQELVDEGIRIAIDDYGAGYSSLAYLNQFPIHTIKIDRYFMSNLVSGSAIRKIVESTIELAKNLGYVIIAEGVEDEKTVSILKELKGTYAQGFYYGHPTVLESLISDYETEQTTNIKER